MFLSKISLPRNLRVFSQISSIRNARNFYDDKDSGSDSDSIIPKPGKKKARKAAEAAAEAKRSAENKFQGAAEGVAKMIHPKDGEKKEKVQAELLSKLLAHINSTSESKPEELKLSDLLAGMKVEKDDRKQESFRGDYVRKTMKNASDRNPFQQGRKERTEWKPRDRTATPESSGSVKLFDNPMGIFKDVQFKDVPNLCPTWDAMEKRELKLSVTHPPANYFEQMILWTEQGKLWKFPINNEQGLLGESQVDFSEHIFLEQHLEGWCPTKGPIRHFMELVCVGLSKNPYVTAAEKKDHIMWYKNYFEDKKELLKELIVESNSSKPKQLDC